MKKYMIAMLFCLPYGNAMTPAQMVKKASQECEQFSPSKTHISESFQGFKTYNDYGRACDTVEYAACIQLALQRLQEKGAQEKDL